MKSHVGHFQQRLFRPVCCPVATKPSRGGHTPTTRQCTSCHEARPRLQCCHPQTARLSGLERRLQPPRCRPVCYPAELTYLGRARRPTVPRQRSCRQPRRRRQYCHPKTARLSSLVSHHQLHQRRRAYDLAGSKPPLCGRRPMRPHGPCYRPVRPRLQYGRRQTARRRRPVRTFQRHQCRPT